MQNQNEAFNALIWQRATKETHSSLTTVELASSLAVAVFNDGATTLNKVLQNLGINAGNHSRKALCHSNRKSSEKHKRKRKKIRQRKKGYIDNLTEQEGTQYEAGAFRALYFKLVSDSKL